MMTRRLFFALALAAAGCRPQFSAVQSVERRSPIELEIAMMWSGDDNEHDSEPLANADPVHDDEFPGVGALIYKTDDGIVHVQCSALELESKRVLTAAHCFASKECFDSKDTGYDRNTYQFVTGKSAVYSDTATAVVSWTIHKDFSPVDCTADVAIATLAADAPQVTGLLSIKDIAPPAPGELIEKVGYGWYSEYGAGGALQPAGRRAKAPMEITGAGSLEGQSSYAFASARNRRAQICAADSGGPSFHDTADGHRQLVGVTSYGNAAGHCRTSPRDTELATYRDWLDAEAR